MKILIVDDDPVSLAVLHKIIAGQPEHQITTTEDGASAWALIDDPNRYFDAAFIDINMPRVDGFTLLQRIRQSPLHSAMEVVLVTSSNDRPTITKAIQLGARHFIAKPSTQAVVLAKLQQLKPAASATSERLIAGV